MKLGPPLLIALSAVTLAQADEIRGRLVWTDFANLAGGTLIHKVSTLGAEPDTARATSTDGGVKTIGRTEDFDTSSKTLRKVHRRKTDTRFTFDEDVSGSGSGSFTPPFGPFTELLPRTDAETTEVIHIGVGNYNLDGSSISSVVGSGAPTGAGGFDPPLTGGAVYLLPPGSANISSGTLTVSPVPEPGQLGILLIGLALTCRLGRRASLR